MSQPPVVVIYDFFNVNRRTHACFASILSHNTVSYKLVTPYHGGEVELSLTQTGVIPLRLSAPQRSFASFSLLLQNLDPTDYIIPVTVHGDWKKTWHQGIAFASKTWIEETEAYINTRSRKAYSLISQLLNKQIPPELEWVGLWLPEE